MRLTTHMRGSLKLHARNIIAGMPTGMQSVRPSAPFWVSVKWHAGSEGGA